MKAMKVLSTALSIACAALAVSGCAGKSPIPLFVVEGAYPPGEPGCDLLFLPAGSKVVIPAGSTWHDEKGKITRKWDKELAVTLKYQAELFSQFYVEKAMGFEATEMKRE